MRLAAFTLAAAVMAAPFSASAQSSGAASAAAPVDSKSITLRGCVVPGADKGTYVLTHVTEIPPAGRSAMPESAHGRRVVFWLDKHDELLKHANHAVEVMGKLDGAEESEVEFKNGDRKDGGLLAEFEGPGKDVRVPTETVERAIGTTGRTTAEKNDLKTMLLKVKVESVKATDYSCREQ
jgi:hypothetical protein